MRAAVKLAIAYLRAGKIYLHPESRTIKGFWITCEPILVTSESDKSLGGQILQILAKSTENIPDPEVRGSASKSWNGAKALLKTAGSRSYEAFAESAICVGILFDGTEVVFTPTLNGGYRIYVKSAIHLRLGAGAWKVRWALESDGGDLPLTQIGRQSTPSRTGSESLQPHQTLDPMQSTRYPFGKKVVPHPPGAIGSIAGQKAAEPSRPDPVATAARTARSCQRGIEPTPRDTERPAQRCRRPDPGASR